MSRALTLAWRTAGRDWRSGESAVLVAALLVAVAAVSSVSFFTDRVEKVMRQHAGAVLAADVRVESRSRIPDSYAEEARSRGMETARTINFPSVVLAGEASALASVKGVDPAYPLRGEIHFTEELFGPVQRTTEVPEPGHVWLAPRLMALLDLAVGDSVSVGHAEFLVTRIVERAPDAGWRFVDAAPLLLMNRSDVEATRLVQPASRVEYALLFAGAPDAVTEFQAWLEENLGQTEDLDTLADSQPELEEALERARRFLGLASLVSVLLAGVAVAMATRRQVQRNLDAVAVMKCMGASQGLILRSLVLQLLGLGLAAAVLGTGLGYLAHAGLLYLVRDLVGMDLPAASWAPAMVGLATALIVLVGFAAAPMMSLRRVPPLRVLRRELGPPPAGAVAVYGSAVLSAAALLAWQVQDPLLFTWVAGGIVGTVLILVAAALGMLKLLAPLRHGAGVAWRYGLANLVRRRAETVVQILAFGLGLMVLLLLSVIHDDLLEGWRASLPEDAPNQFLINIQPDERDGVASFLRESGIEVPRMYPMVRARITHVKGVPAEEYAERRGQDTWFIRREANLTWSPELQEGNEILAGEWWGSDYETPPRVLSLEEERAQRLGIEVGDSFTFDIAGESLTAEVGSIRKVRWDSFRPNFFMVFPPGLLDGLPATWVTSVHVGQDDRPTMVQLVRNYPSVTAFDLDAILSQIRSVMDRASLAVQYVFLFTVAAGVIVLLAAVQATRDQRRLESAMLRTLGASRGVVLAGLATEFGLLGAVSGAVASIAAWGIGWALADQVFELDYAGDPLLWIWGIGAGVLLVVGAGIAATRDVVRTPPARALRAL